MRRSTLFIVIWAIVVMGYTCNVPPIGGGSGPPPPPEDNDTLPPHIVDANAEIVGAIMPAETMDCLWGGPLVYISEIDRFVVLEYDMTGLRQIPRLMFESSDCSGPAFLSGDFGCAVPNNGPNLSIVYAYGDRLLAPSNDLNVEVPIANGSRFTIDDGCVPLPSDNYTFYTTTDVTPTSWPPALPLRLVMPNL
jgi:hypothetical protein